MGRRTLDNLLQLASEGSSRQKLGREAFVERVWEWKKQYGGAIQAQMKRLGNTVDWEREYFTMDDNDAFKLERPEKQTGELLSDRIFDPPSGNAAFS